MGCGKGGGAELHLEERGGSQVERCNFGNRKEIATKIRRSLTVKNPPKLVSLPYSDDILLPHSSFCSLSFLHRPLLPFLELAVCYSFFAPCLPLSLLLLLPYCR